VFQLLFSAACLTAATLLARQQLMHEPFELSAAQDTFTLMLTLYSVFGFVFLAVWVIV
jgi:flagellar biogenesis protein FliO